MRSVPLRLRQPPDRLAVTFAPGETTKVVRVQLLDCAEVEDVETFRFNLTSLGTRPSRMRRRS